VDRYVAFLRGMNLGGRRITNDELRAHVTALGFDGVETFRASGNVLFSAAAGDPEAIAGRLEVGLVEALGYEVPIFLRTGAEVAAIADLAPFGAIELAASEGKPQVAFLFEEPEPDNGREALSLASQDDRLVLDGRELHWLPSGGISESALDLKAIGSLLGPITIRTKGTVEQLAARL
jgi:uncharacterized protein (DUF1697 family)